MCEAVGHPVLALSRVGFGPLRLGSLRPARTVGSARPIRAAARGRAPAAPL